MNRYRASLNHFLISCAIAGPAYLGVRYLWYPGPLFDLGGGIDLLLVVIAVDVTLGPFVTLIIFKPGKWGLKFDLAVIGTLQVAALAYGLATIAEARPVYITFVKDRFELVRAGEIDDPDLEKAAAGFGSLPWFGYRLAGAKIPKDPAEQLRLLDAAILGGKDIQYFPRYYVDYALVSMEAARIAAPIAELRKLNPDRGREIDQALARGGGEDAVGFLPMRAGKHDLTVIVARKSGEVVALLPLRPWEH